MWVGISVESWYFIDDIELMRQINNLILQKELWRGEKQEINNNKEYSWMKYRLESSLHEILFFKYSVFGNVLIPAT